MTKSENLLIIFMKFPRPGAVKTRLQPEISPEGSYRLFRAMCEDLVANLQNSEQFDLQIHFWPPESEAQMRDWLGEHLSFVPQIAGNLGEKMNGAIANSLAAGYRKAAIIGSDLPTLDAARINLAFEKLDSSDAVFGPTDDGGYYLVGMRRAIPALFENIPWSTTSVFVKTMEVANSNHISVALLPQESDIDTFDEVRLLWAQWKNRVADAPFPKTIAEIQRFFN